MALSFRDPANLGKYHKTLSRHFCTTLQLFSQSGKLGIFGTIGHHFARMIPYHIPISLDYHFSM